MNLPNKLSLTRIIIIPFMVLFYLLSPIFVWGKLIALVLFAFGVFTDYLDGHIARKYNLITNLGKFLDSIADKMLTIVALVLIVIDNTILWPYGEIALIIIVCREFIVSALRQMGAVKNVVISADMWGKVKANFQFFTIILFMLFGFLKNVLAFPYWLDVCVFVLCYGLLAVTVISTILSGVHYITKNKEVFTEE